MGTGRDGGKVCFQPLELVIGTCHTPGFIGFIREHVHTLDPESHVLLLQLPIFPCEILPLVLAQAKQTSHNRLSQKTQEFYHNRAGEASSVSRDSSLSWAW